MQSNLPECLYIPLGFIEPYVTVNEVSFLKPVELHECEIRMRLMY